MLVAANKLDKQPAKENIKKLKILHFQFKWATCNLFLNFTFQIWISFKSSLQRGKLIACFSKVLLAMSSDETAPKFLLFSFRISKSYVLRSMFADETIKFALLQNYQKVLSWTIFASTLLFLNTICHIHSTFIF